MGCAQVEEPAQPFQLAIAHINDHHSHLSPHDRTVIEHEGETYQVQSGGFGAVATKIQQIRAGHKHALALHAGDAVAGTLFYTLFAGAADAELMNQICFDAFALGNHEFDNGDKGLKFFLDALAQGDCGTPVLAANVKPEVGVSPLTPKTPWDSFQPFTIFKMGTEKVGLIGLDIAIKTKQSSQPDKTTMFADEYETAAFYIEKLRALGIEKIGLLTHTQYENDIELAQKLPALDFIVGGDSHTLLGDYGQYGLPEEGPYPTVVNNLEGAPVCIVHAWQYSQVVGELVIDFNGDEVSNCGGQPHLLLTPEVPAVLAEQALISVVTPDPEVEALLVQYQQQLDTLTQQVVAIVDERLCMRRMGVATSEDCGLGRQSDAHSAVAQAFLYSAPQADFVLQNGGGVRGEFQAGPLTVAGVYDVLPFANTLVEVQITGTEVKLVLEQALAYALSAGGSDGAYPHGAGIRFDVDLTATDGNRVTNLEVNQQGQWLPLVDSETYVMITNSFLSMGRDGWHELADIYADGRVNDTFVDYAQSFVDWARTQKIIKRPKQHSTQNYTANE